MTVVPLKFRPLRREDFLFTDDAGGFFKADENFLNRYVLDNLDAHDIDFLTANGQAYDHLSDLAYAGFQYRFASRLYAPTDIDYVILVPTLRCNLACSYCQVSRVNETASGFDWDEKTLAAVLALLEGLLTSRIKVEFQGGEPLLRVDLLERVRDFCLSRFEQCEFVVCTNLQELDEAAWTFLQHPDVFISTSLDANHDTHQAQRTMTPAKTEAFLSNLRRAIDAFGTGKISALPTIDPKNPPTAKSVIETFASYGLHSIYLRPINFQGFARKRFDARQSAAIWNAYHADFIDQLVEYNWTAEQPIEEYYFVHCLRRILRSGHNGQADLRNPNIIGHSYLVIDYDGTIYPTDEARMVTRIGQFNLSIGTVFAGIDRTTVDMLNTEALNNFHPDCVHCPYQAYCGVDLVDDLSRYGRIDLPKHLTDFCQRHLGLFDKIFEMIYSDDPKIRKSLALWSGTPRFSAAIGKAHS